MVQFKCMKNAKREVTEVKTSRLLLRAFKRQDVDDVYSYASDLDWQKFLPVPSPYTLEDAQGFVDEQILKQNPDALHWAICIDNRVIGAVALTFFEDYDYKVAELGYSLKRSEWGNGFITEAACAVIDFSFAKYEDLVRIEASADSQNKASLKVMEKLGMTYEGTLRRRHFVRGEVR